ncbi:hypothetical protein MPER_08197 [Moniliophthora perniciosa FA553]|nr:hypothetical protein MPER_08197 [Moniliophthora perniciosa FA553]
MAMAHYRHPPGHWAPYLPALFLHHTQTLSPKRTLHTRRKSPTLHPHIAAPFILTITHQMRLLLHNIKAILHLQPRGLAQDRCGRTMVEIIPWTSFHRRREDYRMPNGHPMDIYPSRLQHVEPDPTLVDPSESGHSGSNKLGKLSGLKKKWVGGMFGGDKSHHQELPPLHENPAASTSTGSLKRTQSAGSDNRSLKDSPMRADDAKRNKKEAERVQREAEKQRRALAEKMQREQARAVMQKRNKIMQKTENIEWRGGSEQPRLETEPPSHAKGKQVATGPCCFGEICAASWGLTRGVDRTEKWRADDKSQEDGV